MDINHFQDYKKEEKYCVNIMHKCFFTVTYFSLLKISGATIIFSL